MCKLLTKAANHAAFYLYNMKATLFYITAVLTMVLLMTEMSLAWLIMGAVDIILILWCKHNISLREMSKLTGYDIWYKALS